MTNLQAPHSYESYAASISPHPLFKSGCYHDTVSEFINVYLSQHELVGHYSDSVEVNRVGVDLFAQNFRGHVTWGATCVKALL